ncbi:helix-turn-helix domain-containing protein [Shimia thalassica]|uniref:helix-turn-helix domain-containing protein n=1 Tax=Shimia thalassica TaxID=1715693 RepID=UPI0024944672|nr:helix-turn-helix transcriptional regulator [Shimia thalassica]
MAKFKFRFVEEDKTSRDIEYLDSEVMHLLYGPKRPLHENLRNYRIRLSLKKYQAAKLMGVTPRTYYSYETGKSPIPLEAIVELATYTGGNLNEVILGRTGTDEDEIVQSVFEDTRHILTYLSETYPKMERDVKDKIASNLIAAKRSVFPRTDPETIKAEVVVTTGYRFHPEDLPAPPYWPNFIGNEMGFDEAMNDWEEMCETAGVNEDPSGETDEQSTDLAT